MAFSLKLLQLKTVLGRPPNPTYPGRSRKQMRLHGKEHRYLRLQRFYDLFLW